jgi:O-acetyl-ADP-ribose deacetylase (regulator of RNase III)
MIQYVSGNLLEADVEALINTVNCVGVMGKGIALQFKQAFPANFEDYAKACRSKTVQTGKIHIFATGNMVNPRFIINFPTKKHWREASRIEYIEQGLLDLKQVIAANGIRSIAVPPLGCGNGGLEWQVVKAKIEQALGDMAGVDVWVYPPNEAPAPDQMPIKTSQPPMTRSRALFVKLIELYSQPGYRLSLLEVQKLAYFLQVAGEPLRLNYAKHLYGPYADNLNHVLQRMEGHFIRGYGDRSKDAQIYLLAGAVQQAEQFLAEDAEATQRLQQVSELIEGFETPYGMELLATVHWITDERKTSDNKVIQQGVTGWSPRKAKLMHPKHIDKALTRLKIQAW